MKNIRFSGIAAIFCLALFFLSLSFSSGQDVSVKSPEEVSKPESAEPLKIKVSVEEVRLDVVVLDKKTGNPVTDLTAADFEVFQDGKRQVITSSVYIDSQPDAAARSTAPPNSPNLPLSPVTALKKEDVHRTIVFLVDDYAMTFENGYYTKMALRNFVEKQMQPGDMVSILRTNYGNRAINMFLSDKREVLARINAIPPTMAPRLETMTPVGDTMYENFLWRRYENQASTLFYSFRSLENMPGRKILLVMTPFSLPDDPSMFEDHMNKAFMTWGQDKIAIGGGLGALVGIELSKPNTIVNTASTRARMIPDSTRIKNLLEKLSDDALRAGVVVNYLDIDGLYNYFADAGIWPADGLSFYGDKETSITFP